MTQKRKERELYMKKRILSMLLALVMVATLLPVVAIAANAYSINGKIVRYDDFTSSPNECWAYANNVYNKIWGRRFSNEFGDVNNSLRNLSDSQLTLTSAHLKAYVSNAKLGAVIRICNSEYLHGSDGWGHSQIIVQKDSNGFTVFEGGLSASPYCREKYYTWSNYLNSYSYAYIKYIKWPGAPAYVDAHTCDRGSYQYYEAAHPHYKCYKCSICGKIWRDESEPTRVDSCELCYPRTATITYYDADGYVWTTDSSLANESYTLAAGYPTRSGSYFTGWSYTPGTSGFDLRPDDTVTIKGNTDLYPVYVTHEQAVSGEPVCIYNISDFDSTGYEVSSIQYNVNTRVDDSAWGEWSDYTFSDVSASDTTQVETDTLYRYYHYLCPSCGAHEPFYGKSDCGAQIPSDAWHEFWSTVPYASCKPQSFSYTSAKYYTTSLGDGEIWCFSAGNLHDTAPGTIDSGGSAPVIKTGYMTRNWETKYETVVRNVTAYQITKATVDYGSCGENLTWELDDDGVLTISGTGSMTDFEAYNAPWYRHRTLIETAVIQHGVTSIGEYAFYECSSLTRVTIPNSVTSIREGSFNRCSSLTGVTIPNGVTSIEKGAFIFCSTLAHVTIPDSLTSIGEYTFYECSSLTSVTIPNSVTQIGFGAFSGSNAAISVASGNSKYCSVAGALYNKQKTTLFYPGMIKEGSFRIPNSVTTIANSAFKGCSSLTSVTIPNSVTSIGDEAFSYCTGLTSVTIPNSVTSIEDYTFNRCESLTHVTIPNSVTRIGDWAFALCSSLTSVTIPDSVTSIGDKVFEECKSLTRVTIPDSVTSIGDWAFALCSSLTSVTIPDSVTSIGNRTFWCCSALTSFTIPKSVTNIEEYAFGWCKSLADVYYGGTETDWAKITIANGNQDLLNATLHAKPAAPANVKLVGAKVVTGGIQVAWQAADGAAQYRVYRKDAANPNWKVLTSSATGTSYVDKTAKAGVKYTYTVRGINGDGVLSPSYDRTGVSTTVPKPTPKPTAPAIVKLTGAKVVTGGIQVTWQKAAGAAQYRVYRKGPGETKWTGIINVTGTSWTDKTAKAGSTYTYTVRGIAKDGKTLSSSYDKIGVSAVIAPAKVVLVSAKADSAGVLVTWQKAAGAHSYQVFRKTANTGWQRIAKNIHDTEWKDIDAVKGTKYFYTVRAVADDGATRGAYDKTGKPATVTKNPTTPADVTLGKAVAGKSGITVTWSYAADARTYRVYRKAAGENKWTIVAKNAKGKSWTDKNVTKGVKYTYTVRGVNANGVLSSRYNGTGVSAIAK